MITNKFSFKFILFFIIYLFIYCYLVFNKDMNFPLKKNNYIFSQILRIESIHNIPIIFKFNNIESMGILLETILFKKIISNLYYYF